MSLSNQIMKLRTTSKNIGTAVEEAMDDDNDLESRLALAYRLGHRDARHEAAELAVKSDTIKAKLTEALKQLLVTDRCDCLDGDKHGDCDFCNAREALAVAQREGLNEKYCQNCKHFNGFDCGDLTWECENGDKWEARP